MPSHPPALWIESVLFCAGGRALTRWDDTPELDDNGACSESDAHAGSGVLFRPSMLRSLLHPRFSRAIPNARAAAFNLRAGCWVGSEGVECIFTKVDHQTRIALEPERASEWIDVEGLEGAAEVAIGARHTCARTREGLVWCWGANEHGQSGDREGLGVVDRPHRVALEGVRAISADGDLSCALLSDGSVRCWGGRESSCHASPRECGDNSVSIDRPTRVAGLEPARELRGACARTGDGWRCWDAELTARAAPQPRDPEAGTEHQCELHEGGVRCRGERRHGQLGDRRSSYGPHRVAGIERR